MRLSIVLRVISLSLTLVIGLTYIVFAQSRVCFNLRNPDFSDTTVEIMDNICGGVQARTIPKGSTVQICTCADNIGKADISTRIQGNSTWTRNAYIKPGDTVSY